MGWYGFALKWDTQNFQRSTIIFWTLSGSLAFVWSPCWSRHHDVKVAIVGLKRLAMFTSQPAQHPHIRANTRTKAIAIWGQSVSLQQDMPGIPDQALLAHPELRRCSGKHLVIKNQERHILQLNAIERAKMMIGLFETGVPQNLLVSHDFPC